MKYFFAFVVILSIILLMSTGDIASDPAGEYTAGDSVSVSYSGICVNRRYVSGATGEKLIESMRQEPEIDYVYCPGQLYTLMLLGTPARKEFSIFPTELLWIVVNIRENKINSGESLWHYRPPNPPINIAYKYSLIIYKQKGVINRAENIMRRLPADFAELVRRYGLEKNASEYFIVKKIK